MSRTLQEVLITGLQVDVDGEVLEKDVLSYRNTNLHAEKRLQKARSSFRSLSLFSDSAAVGCHFAFLVCSCFFPASARFRSSVRSTVPLLAAAIVTVPAAAVAVAVAVAGAAVAVAVVVAVRRQWWCWWTVLLWRRWCW